MNKPSFLFIIFNIFYGANMDGGEMESHHACAEIVVFIFYTCSCRHLRHWNDGGNWPNINGISSFNQSFYRYGTGISRGKYNSHTNARQSRAKYRDARRATFTEARRRRTMPETHAVEEALEAAVNGQAHDVDEAMVARP